MCLQVTDGALKKWQAGAHYAVLGAFLAETLHPDAAIPALLYALEIQAGDPALTRVLQAAQTKSAKFSAQFNK